VRRSRGTDRDGQTGAVVVRVTHYLASRVVRKKSKEKD
jgi:hypothetical protein